MATKNIIVAVDSFDCAYKFQRVFSDMDVHILNTATSGLSKSLLQNRKCDLVICEFDDVDNSSLNRIVEGMANDDTFAMLFVVDENTLERIEFPTRVKCDFVMTDASIAELSLRARRLLWADMASASPDVVYMGSMVMNLATYQVKVNDAPVDLTYLEYALLSFLVTHPNRTFSRDTLLQRVWGFDYYGGSRTVDVHVRRVRAKLGPELANRLETVRGVGYMWSC